MWLRLFFSDLTETPVQLPGCRPLYVYERILMICARMYAVHNDDMCTAMRCAHMFVVYKPGNCVILYDVYV